MILSSKVSRRLFNLAFWVWTICLISGISLNLFAPDFIRGLTYQAYIIQSGSMEPAIPAGSLIVDRAMLPDQYRVDDIVTYLDVSKQRKFITHRITEITQKAGGVKIFQSKGDANPNGDNGYRGIGSIVGKVVLVVPYLGFPISWLKTPVGFVGISLVVTAFLTYLLIFSSLRESELAN